ncbi:MAG: DEAD/DEAH box helicase family protein [Bacteroidaceae bacterium]|nr:DEAD/DEAH box helicase family protein [Bacteroidaceae bacterium]
MNIQLKPFQKQRVIELRRTAAMAQMNWQHFGAKQIISFTAPTGAGKTIMMASFMESMMCGDDEGMVAAIPETIFIWLSDSPELNEQSKKKIMAYCDKLVLSQFRTLDESFRGEKLELGKVYFLNTQKLTKTSKMTSVGDGRDWTIWETIENTIEEYGKNLVLIIDEAHRGAKTNQTTIMQKFVNGSEPDCLQSLPFIIGMSATPERFNALAGHSLSALNKVVVSAKEVRDSGLLKDTIEIHFPEESVINKNTAVLQAAADEWKDKCLHWYNYTEKQHYPNVCPIFVIQVEPAVNGKVSATDLDECLREIEKRTGESFESGEVVHCFGEQSTMTINGIEVPYCAPSAINDDRKIKIVFFKEALSTGWDCPRAEAMMSYRVARDATYIAQLLGRMIRTPLKMRIEVDESLNYVHLYLPHFDEQTVEDVVKKLTEEEGAALPTDIQSVQGGNKTTVVMSARRPVNHNPSIPSSGSSQLSQTENGLHQRQTESVPSQINNEQLSNSKWSEHPSTNDQPAHVEDLPILEQDIDIDESVETPVVDPYEEVKDAINTAEILTYEIHTVAETKNYLRALFDMARLALLSGMDSTCQAVDNVRNHVIGLIHQYVEGLKERCEYDALVDKALEFQLNTISFELYKGNAMYESQQGPDLFSKTDAGINFQFQQAETLLCGEEIGKRYTIKYDDEDDENAAMYDVILYAADEHQRALLMEYAKFEFYRLADLYRPKTKNISEKYRIQYNSLVTHGSTVSKHLFHLPETINVDLDKDGEECTDHLFVNSDGTAKFKLIGWEPITLAEERSNPEFVCWLRNQDRKPWALCIPYEYGNEVHRMYPDFIIVRKDSNGDYDYAILEPHRDDKKDNLAKAKGLVKYVEECPVFSRVQMLRKIHNSAGDKMLRLDFTKMAVRDKVKACITESDYDTVFETEGFFDILERL